MRNSITRTASTALVRAGDAAAHAAGGVRSGMSRWLSRAVKLAATGTQFAILREGSRKAAKVVKRNPVTTAAAIAVAAGAGAALWLLRRDKRSALDEEMRTIEVKSVRMSHAAKVANKRAPRKTAAKRAAKVKTGAL